MTGPACKHLLKALRTEPWSHHSVCLSKAGRRWQNQLCTYEARAGGSIELGTLTITCAFLVTVLCARPSRKAVKVGAGVRSVASRTDGGNMPALQECSWESHAEWAGTSEPLHHTDPQPGKEPHGRHFAFGQKERKAILDVFAA